MLQFVFFKAQESNVEIIGKTNINTFKCSNGNINQVNFAINSKGNHQNLPEIILAVKDFDCHNKLMTKDFQAILNAANYPNLIIKFLNISKTTNNLYKANIEVNIINKKKTYSIDLVYGDKNIYGKKNVKFSDFGIQPPKKMGGLITVNDNLELVFNLKTTD